jgi:beta-mannanase
MKKILFLCLLGILLSTIRITAQIDGDATTQTKNLYKNLKKLAFDRRDILFGQEFFNTQSFGINEQNDPNVSDYKSTTGDHPAVLGQDFKWYLTKSWELARMKAAAKYVYNNGGVVTMDFHMDSKYHDGHEFKKYQNQYEKVDDTYLMFNIGSQNNNYQEMTWFNGELQKVANVLNDLKIPIVVRLFHEMNGNWMWWGTQAYGGSDSYIKMYKYAVDYIKNRTQYALFAWTPNYPFDSGNNPGINYYPGDNYVDVVGVDFYDIGSSN